MRILPPEWSNAFATLKVMNGAAPRTPVGAAAFGWLAPFLVGAVGSYFFAIRLAEPARVGTLLAILAAVLAFGGLLVGFLVTLMLFTGRLHSLDGMKLEVVKGYAARVRYLLASQASSLGSALVMSLLSVIAMLLAGVEAPQVSTALMSAATFGFFTVCAVRSLLLPMQIYELHQAALNDEIKKAADANAARYANRAKEPVN